MELEDELNKALFKIASQQSSINEKVMAKALKEVMECGDFLAFVNTHNEIGNVVYQPYRLLNKMQERVKFLEKQLKFYEDEKETGEMTVLLLDN